VDEEEVVGEKAGADVTDVGETDSSTDFAGGWFNVVYTSIY
jgi:hypothetical protein